MAPDLRRTVRFRSEAELEAVERAARVAGVATGALLRECGLRWGPVLAAARATGQVDSRMRARGKGS